ncbi:MAG TPA: 50S ribosomal protein L25 [Gaiellaceae bacterium]|nr:50S ribosomal protein L25 [Gaiellaceae bacterium]
MAGERTKLVVAQRDRTGSRETRRLRREGLVPGVLYGNGDPVAISVAERELRRALTGEGGLHAILDVEIDGAGKTHPSILKDYQVDKIRGGVTHVDLQEVRLDQTIHASVTVQLVGGEDAPGVREGGVLQQQLRELSVEALPLEVPPAIELDVSGLAIGEALRVSDVTVPEGVKLLDDPETVLASVTAPTRAIEVEAAEGEEAAEAAEGEAPAAAAEPAEAEAPAESSGEEG